MSRGTRLSITALLLSMMGATIPQARAQSAFNINLTAVHDSVVFLYSRNAAGELQGGGTAFLMGVKTKADPNRFYFLLVTARHVVDPAWAGCPAIAGTLFAAFNKKDHTAVGGAKTTLEYPLSLSQNGIPAWSFPNDDSVDIAVTVLNPVIFATGELENMPLGLAEIPTPQELKAVTTGSQIVSAGLLLGAQGVQRNYPIFKFGYVSSIPEEKIPTACCVGCTARPETEWMIAASLVPGNSGSPIFYVPPGFGGMGIAGQRSFLLGIQSTSFIGSDVAGMAPVSFLLGAVSNLRLPDADLPADPSPDPTVKGSPSSVITRPDATPGPLPKKP